jgi:hypothetical protein
MKLFKVFKSIHMQSFNIFGARDGFLFEFTSLSRVWKFENHLTDRARMSAVRFCLTARDGRPVQRTAPVPLGHAHRRESTRRRWPPVSLPHVACPPPPLTTSPDVTEGGVSHLTLSPASFGRSPRCSTPCQPLLCLHCPSSMSRPELSDRTQRSASSPRPSCTESLPTAPTSQTGPRDFPVVIFLHEHLTGSSLLRCSPTPSTPQRALHYQGAPPRPPLRPPRPLPQPLTGVSSLSAYVLPQNRLPR